MTMMPVSLPSKQAVVNADAISYMPGRCPSPATCTTKNTIPGAGMAWNPSSDAMVCVFAVAAGTVGLVGNRLALPLWATCGAGVGSVLSMPAPQVVHGGMPVIHELHSPAPHGSTRTVLPFRWLRRHKQLKDHRESCIVVLSNTYKEETRWSHFPVY